MAITVAFAGVATADYDAAAAWYERLLGRAPDMLPHAGEAAWQLTGEGWLYVVADAARAGGALLTLLVDDLDAHVAELARRELEPTRTETLAGIGRKAIFTDPDGNTVAFAQVNAA